MSNENKPIATATLASQIRQKGESWKDAMSRAAKMKQAGSTVREGKKLSPTLQRKLDKKLAKQAQREEAAKSDETGN